MKQDFKATGFVKSAGVITGAVAVVGAAGYGVTSIRSSQANPTPQTSSPASGTTANGTTARAGSAASPDAVPYTPSKYPGVMVRNVPAASSGGGKGWIYVRPGTAKPHLGKRIGTRGPIWYEAGKTPAGGIVAHVTRDFYPYEVAKIGPDGKVRFDCVESGTQSPLRKNSTHSPTAKTSQSQHVASPAATPK